MDNCQLLSSIQFNAVQLSSLSKIQQVSVDCLLMFTLSMHSPELGLVMDKSGLCRATEVPCTLQEERFSFQMH